MDVKHLSHNQCIACDSVLPPDFEVTAEVIWPDTGGLYCPPVQRAERCQCTTGNCLDNGCSNYAMMEECGSSCPNGANCRNNRISKKDWSPLIIKPTPHKGHGLFARKEIPKGTFIIEYCGEVIGEKNLNERFRNYKNERMLYILQLTKGVYIDARKKGGVARFINHCCEPNCTMDKWKVKGAYRMCVMSTRTILEGEELTFDYQWEKRPGRPRTKCYCGVPSCRGFLETDVWVEDPESGKAMGIWRKPKPDEKGNTLVGKKVKIYFDGNYSYLEAEVFEYDAVTDKHECKFLCDGEDTKERLDPSDPNCDFYVFDETVAPTAIKKRDGVGNSNSKVNVFDGDNGDLDVHGNVIVRNRTPKADRKSLGVLSKRSKPYLCVQSLFAGLKQRPSNISVKFNCRMIQVVRPRNQVSPSELLSILGLTSQDKHFVEIVFEGQRSKEAFEELEFVCKRKFETAVAEQSQYKDLQLASTSAAPSKDILFICDPTVVGALKKFAAGEITIQNPIQIPSSEVRYPDGDIGGYSLVRTSLPEHGSTELEDELYAKASAGPVFCGRKLGSDSIDEEYLDFLAAKLGGRVKVVNCESNLYIFYEGMKPSEIDETVHADFISHMEKVANNYHFVRVSPNTYAKVKPSLEAFLSSSCTHEYDGEAFLEIKAFPEIEVPSKYETAKGKWLKNVAESVVALRELKTDLGASSMFTSDRPPPKVENLSLADQRTATSELILLHQVTVANKFLLDTSTAMHAAAIFSRFYSGGSTKDARDLAIAALFLAHKSSKLFQKSFKSLKPLEMLVRTYYKTVYPNNPMRDEEVVVVMEKVVNLEEKILETLNLNVVSDHGYWGLRRIEMILGKSDNVKRCLGFTRALYKSGQILALGAGNLIGKYDCLTLTAACYLLFDKSPASAQALLLKMGVMSRNDVEDCANAILQVAPSLTNERYPDHVEVANIFAKIDKSAISLPAALVQTFGGKCVAKMILRGSLKKVLEDKFAELSRITFCEVIYDKYRKEVLVKGSDRGVCVFVEMLLSFDSDFEITMSRERGGDKLDEIRINSGSASSIIDISTVKAKSPDFNVRYNNKFPLQNVSDAKLAHLLPLKHGLAIVEHLTDMDCFSSDPNKKNIESQMKVVDYLVGAGVDNGIEETLELSRWPLSTLALKESVKIDAMKLDARSLGFSPVALQELNFLHLLHTQAGTGGNMNFVLPVGVLKDAEKLNMEEEKEEATDFIKEEEDFDIDNLKKKKKKKAFTEKKGKELENEKKGGGYRKRKIEEVRKIAEEGNNGCDDNWGLHFINKLATPYSMAMLLQTHVRGRMPVGVDFLRGLTTDFLGICMCLHENNMCLGKMDMSSMVIGEDGRIVMGSVGGVTSWRESDDMTGTKRGKEKEKGLKLGKTFLPFAAPEVLLGATKYTPKTDMWLVGALVASLALGKHAFSSKDKNPNRIGTFIAVSKIVGSIGSSNFEKGKGLPLYNDYKKEMVEGGGKKYKPGVEKWLGMMLGKKEGDWSKFIDFLSKLLILDPEKRVDVTEISQHAWLLTGDDGWRGYGKGWVKVRDVLRGNGKEGGGGEKRGENGGGGDEKLESVGKKLKVEGKIKGKEEVKVKEGNRGVDIEEQDEEMDLYADL